MRKPLLLLAGIALSALSAPVMAKKKQEPYQAPPPTIVAEPIALMIAGFDRDGDAVVSRAEYEAGKDAAFAVADGDGSGDLSPIEFGNWSDRYLGSQGALPGLLDFDSDGDNKVTRAEYAAAFAGFFATYDSNKDGLVARNEMLRFRPGTYPDFRRKRR